VVYNLCMRKLRIGIGIIILVLSLAVLAWGLWPAAHERRTLAVPPAQMTLPTPSSFNLLPGNARQDLFTALAAHTASSEDLRAPKRFEGQTGHPAVSGRPGPGEHW
jgi:hypothetical protein